MYELTIDFILVIFANKSNINILFYLKTNFLSFALYLMVIHSQFHASLLFVTTFCRIACRWCFYKHFFFFRENFWKFSFVIIPNNSEMKIVFIVTHKARIINGQLFLFLEENYILQWGRWKLKENFHCWRI